MIVVCLIMEIVAKGRGVWQAGYLWIVSQVGFKGVKKPAYIDFLPIIEKFDDIVQRTVAVQSFKGLYLLTQLQNVDERSLPAEIQMRRELVSGVNSLAYAALAKCFKDQILKLQSQFSVSLVEEYTLQSLLDDFKHEEESLLFQQRVEELKRIRESDQLKQMRLRLERELIKLLNIQADLAKQIASAIHPLFKRIPALKEMEGPALCLSRVLRNEASLNDLYFLLRYFGWQPVLLGNPKDPQIAAALDQLYEP